MDTFKTRLRKLRENKDLTQEELAKAIGVTRSSLASWETGRREPDFETVSKLADFFNVSVDYLLGRDDNSSQDDRQYVIDDDALEYLDELHKRPEMKTLFDVSRKASKEDIETAIAIIEALKKKGRKE